MASCRWCKRDFSQVEARKMVTAHQQPDGSLAYTVPTENKHATGPLVWAAHYKEYKEHVKRELRGGNAVSGSSLGAVTPTAYDYGTDTAAITERQQLKRTIAQEFGIDSENWRVAEVMRSRDHGGAYHHTHERRLEPWKAEWHLSWAHGVGVLDEDPNAHVRAHAAEHIRMEREHQPDTHPDQDWHDSIDIDV